MRVNENGQQERKKKNFFARNIYAFLLGFCLVAIALVVTLTLVLKPKLPAPPDTPTIVPPAAVTFVDPMEKCVVIKEASLEELVYSNTLKQLISHEGVDLKASIGDKALCIAEGTVEAIEETALEGTCVTIAHKDGMKSIYKSLSDKIDWKVGDTISAKAVVGVVANNMMNEQLDGVHLHLEMCLNGTNVNPSEYLPFGETK